MKYFCLFFKWIYLPLSRWMCLVKGRSTRNRKSGVFKHRNETIFCKMKTCKHPKYKGYYQFESQTVSSFRKNSHSKVAILKRVLQLKINSPSEVILLLRENFLKVHFSEAIMQEDISDGSWQEKIGNVLCFLNHKSAMWFYLFFSADLKEQLLVPVSSIAIL